jgi:hypothetical protein
MHCLPPRLNRRKASRLNFATAIIVARLEDWTYLAMADLLRLGAAVMGLAQRRQIKFQGRR